MTVLMTIVLVMTGAGIAGQAVAGATWEADITVDQALAVIGGSVAGADSGRVIVNDNGTAFKAPAMALGVSFSSVSTPGLSG